MKPFGTLDPEEAFRDAWYRGRDQLLDLRGARVRTAALEYASWLDRAGGTRPKLIRLDASGVKSAESRLQRRDLLAGWLGESVASRPGVRSTYGLVNLAVTQDDSSLLREVLASPGGAYIEALELEGERPMLATWLEELATSQHRWLGMLTVRRVGTSGDDTAVRVSPATIDAIINGTPELRLLVVDGTSVLREFEHPTLSYLDVRGPEAAAGLAGPGPAFHCVQILKLILRGSSCVDLLPTERFPALRELDLSSNEPTRGAPTCGVDVIGMLETVGVRHQLEKLSLPSIRTRAAAEHLELMISGMPTLRSVQIARTYGNRI
ncbi:MAG: hypothetical protein IPQ07_29000, partial [Myxococcales bacterium]|nr:hypothetical protein [Myxococcales bacterium]